MSNDFFQFKHFIVKQSSSGMKVGTDSCLLGSWVNVENCRRILDIGNVIKYYKCLPGTRISAVSRNTTITSKKNRENQAKERELEELRIQSLLNDVPKEEQIKKLREEKERFEAFKAAYEEVRQKSYDVEEDYQQRLF